MLFDLRSPRRRITVRVVYGFLAILMVVGLVGLGIGTGNTGGLLNAGGNNNGSGGSNNSLGTKQVNDAIKAVNKNPSAANWAALMTARYVAAGSGYNSSTGVYSAAGKAQLQKGADAWQQYLTATGNKPSLSNAHLAARMYQNLAQWTNATQAWNYAAQSATGAERLTPFYCLALAAYSAKQTAKGNLAAAQALALTTKANRLTQKAAFQEAKTSPTQARQALVANC